MVPREDDKITKDWWQFYYKVSLAVILAGLTAFGTIYWWDRTKIETACTISTKNQQEICDVKERINVHREEINNLHKFDYEILKEIRDGNQRIYDKITEMHKNR